MKVNSNDKKNQNGTKVTTSLLTRGLFNPKDVKFVRIDLDHRPTIEKFRNTKNPKKDDCCMDVLKDALKPFTDPLPIYGRV